MNDIKVTPNQARLMKIIQRSLLPIQVESATKQVSVVMRTPFKLRATAPEFHPQGLLGLPTNTTTPSVAAATSSTSDPPQFSTQDSAEVEVLADIEAPELSDAIGDNPMVDDTFCRICACELTSDISQSTEGTGPTTKSGIETYSYHCRTEKHNTNSELYENFDSEVKEYYNPKKEAVHKLLSLIQEDKDLRSLLDNVEKELKESDNEIFKIRQSAEWTEGMVLIRNTLSGKLEMMQMKLKRMIEESEKRKLELEKAREVEAMKEEEESQEVYESDEEEEIEPENSGAKHRSNQRMKAKNRHKRRNK